MSKILLLQGHSWQSVIFIIIIIFRPWVRALSQDTKDRNKEPPKQTYVHKDDKLKTIIKIGEGQ
jgi:hypothetical protein